ncbi:MAG TPA: DUF308 domain-containing protein [Gemmatimonadaceae bacterium]|nr:DUF308 domain-containing protein [Gemmatimonadaceae bacterium]
MASDLIQSAYRRTWWSLVLRGLLALALGIFILWRPVDSVASFALFIAIWALVIGIVEIVRAIELRSLLSHWWLLLISGLVSVAFGIAAFYYYPGLSLAFAVVWVTWWLLITGALAIYAAYVERQNNESWGWTAAAGVAAIVAAVFAFMHPPATLAAILGLIAAFAIVSGLILLVGAFKLSSAKRDVTDRIRTAATS